ncbi:uncharacterized protein LOC134723177 [Mytilus trossulus]|uniref:uncharacterized protein LOC134723177 n=1 Tax=Mytilus trossulus TaxID=6551 RepID=UPI003006B933
MTANCLYVFLFMQTLMLTLGKLAIKTNCNVKGSPCTISCSIPAYEQLASWSRDNKLMTSCSETSFCNTQSILLYSFSANRTGIYVVISDLTTNENGIKWTCTHGVDTPVSISISIPKRDHIDESGLAGGSVAGIVIGVLVPVIIGIIIIVCLVFRNKKDDRVRLN